MAPKRGRQLEAFLGRLRSLGDRLSTEPQALAAVARDASHAEPGVAAAVVWPRQTAEISLICREAQALGIALVPRGAGTGKAGAAVPGEGQVVVDLSRLTQLKQLAATDLYAVVEPGMTPRALDQAAWSEGLMYPPDPASLEQCSLGGTIATNAGGPRALKYGVTEHYVWGLQVVLAGGDVLKLGRQSLKGVAGYNLTGLWVGSEGTLGIIAEATLHLVPAPRGVQTAWLTFADPLQAAHAAERIFAAGLLPRMLEILDARALEAVRGISPWAVPAGQTALLVETDGYDDETAYRDLLALCRLAEAETTQVASHPTEQEQMRWSRRQISGALKQAYPYKISDDIAVPRSRMPDLLRTATEAAEAAGLHCSAYGHLGDGNLHINILCRTAQERQRAASVQRQLWEFAVGIGGTVTGEHGIGLCKREALGLEQGAELLAWQRRMKACFDPKGIMNPGKVF